MIPITGSGGSEQGARRTYAPDEEIPESGIYQVLHASGEKETVVLLCGNTFPACADCGSEVRYSVVRTAPYIFDDEDFK